MIEAGRPQSRSGSSIDAAEIDKFARMAEAWWDPEGDFAPLHAQNPARLTFLRDRACALFGRDPLAPRPLSGLRVLDIGCGGGLVSEPLARMGARVLGIDASEDSVRAATTHAEDQDLDLAYRCVSAEELLLEGKTFDLVTALEVVEHVADLEGFLAAATGLVRPGGGFAASTLNRTVKSFGMAIVGAEYVLRWLPRGTHDWRRFLRPSELTRLLRQQGLRVTDLSGIVYNPLTRAWRLDPRDLDVNYMLFAEKPEA